NTSSTINEAIQMATYNPACSLGISYRKGSIEVGKDADLVVFDEDFEIKKVFIEGKLVLDED
ncbi:MAG: amidohydrolase family protein, partial [Actinobacteria bacterium]|nr:amidohydrolase family protein [Actinomycetota bacterium]